MTGVTRNDASRGRVRGSSRRATEDQSLAAGFVRSAFKLQRQGQLVALALSSVRAPSDLGPNVSRNAAS